MVGGTEVHSSMTSSRLQRFALSLVGNNYNLIHQQGSSIASADGLSRLPLCDSEKGSEMREETVFSLDVFNSTPVASEQVKR